MKRNWRVVAITAKCEFVIWVCDMTHGCDLTHVCDMSYSYVYHESFTWRGVMMKAKCEFVTHVCGMTHVCDRIHCVWLDSFIRVAWIVRLTRGSDKSRTWVRGSFVWHDVFICVTWRIYVCGLTHSYVWHDSLICVAWPIHISDVGNTSQIRIGMWRIHTCDMTYPYVQHDSFMWLALVTEGKYEFVLIHMCDMLCHSHVTPVTTIVMPHETAHVLHWPQRNVSSRTCTRATWPVCVILYARVMSHLWLP